VAALVTVAPPGGGGRAAATSPPDYYVSLGDSYGAGYQPIPSALTGTDSNGFAYQVVQLARAKGYRFILKNFACDAATTTSILTEQGCKYPVSGGDGATYPKQTQAVAAEQFIAKHRGEVGLVTVSIGGNDILSCTTPAVVLSCEAGVMATIKTNLATLLNGLRRAAGSRTRIVGSTYPDVVLGLYVSDPAEESLARTSVGVFRRLLNPTLRAQYDAVGGSLVDVTQAAGSYIPLDKTTDLAPYGTIPEAVADLCHLTYYCQVQDIHPRAAGYRVIARLIVKTLPSHR
jgi:lysophospholipase L1-like esterase